MRLILMWGRFAALVALLVASVACSATGSTGLGSGALGPPLDDATKVAEWVYQETGQCGETTDRTIEEFAEFVGPLRTKLYAPFVAEWATCKAGPYERLGLVVFHREKLAEFQRSWQEALKSGEVADDPDFGFGNGFALSGTIGLELLGLHQLKCRPLEFPVKHTLPAEQEGCAYVQTEDVHHH